MPLIKWGGSDSKGRSALKGPLTHKMQPKHNMGIDRASHPSRVTLIKLSLPIIKYSRLGRLRTWSLYRFRIFPRETFARSLNESCNSGCQWTVGESQSGFLGMKLL